MTVAREPGVRRTGVKPGSAALLVVVFALLITAVNYQFLVRLPMAENATGDSDEATWAWHLWNSPGADYFFPELKGRSGIARNAAFYFSLIKAGVQFPAEGIGAWFVFYPGALLLRWLDSYLAVKLLAVAFLTLIYLLWSGIVARLYSIRALIVLSLLFLLPPFNYRYAFTALYGSQDTSLLFTSLLFLALACYPKRWRALWLSSVAMIAAMGLAACQKNLIDVLLVLGLVAFLQLRRTVGWRAILAAGLCFVAVYSVLGCGLLSIGLDYTAQFTYARTELSESNRSYAREFVTAAQGLAERNADLLPMLRRIFVYRTDLAARRLPAVDYLMLALIAAAVLYGVRQAAAGWRAEPAPGRLVMMAATGYLFIFAVVYLVSPIRVYDFYALHPLSGFRYVVSLYPIWFLLLAVFLGERAISPGVVRLKRWPAAFPVLCLASVFAYPLLATSGKMLAPRVPLESYRAVFFAPLGKILSRVRPGLTPAELEAALAAVAERDADVEAMARDYFEATFRHNAPDWRAWAENGRPGTGATVQKAFYNAVGIMLNEPSGSSGRMPPIPAALLTPAEMREIWRGVGIWTGPRCGLLAEPQRFRAMLAGVPEEYRAVFLQGAGEGIVQSRYDNAYHYTFELQHLLRQVGENYALPIREELQRGILATARYTRYHPEDRPATAMSTDLPAAASAERPPDGDGTGE